ncbi:MAG: alpha-galactosidase [Clostridiales bacterium]|nr:alpha-galactosidase [Clostridiales bacterium]
MKKPEKLKFVIIGAGSVCFCPATVADILLNENITSVPLSIALMDIDERALRASETFAREAIQVSGKEVTLTATINLREALVDADFVISAIEVDRYYYWSMDFHIPRRYGFRQVYGENGGPGSMFHTLRNLPPTLEIAHAMEEICPDAWLLNYTNPEAKLVEGVLKGSKIKAVGLCHGEGIGLDQVSQILGVPREDIDADVAGLNHFGWFTRLTKKSTGEDLYPLLKEREGKMDWLAHWDELGLSRLMLRTYGLFPYPGTNHVGEYIAWSDAMLASTQIQYFHDPVRNDPWSKGGKVPEFVYNFQDNPTGRELFPVEEDWYEGAFHVHDGKLYGSGEYGIPIAEAIAFDIPRHIGAVNVQNFGLIPNVMEGMVVEVPADVDGNGIHPQKCPELPGAVAAMINTQGAIHKLVLEAYHEQSRNKLLQAMLLDPTVSNYNNAVALINEMCERQKELLPPMHW